MWKRASDICLEKSKKSSTLTNPRTREIFLCFLFAQGGPGHAFRSYAVLPHLARLRDECPCTQDIRVGMDRNFVELKRILVLYATAIRGPNTTVLKFVS